MAKKSKQDDFLSSLPDSENDFLADLPDSGDVAVADAPVTSTGLPKLSFPATPTITAAEKGPTVNPQLPELMSGLTLGTSQPQPTTEERPIPTSNIDTSQFVSDLVEQTLPAVAMTAGTAGAAALTGGTSLLAQSAGGVLGYAAGKSGSDLLQRAMGKKAPLNDLPEALLETGENLVEGAKVEMGGQILGKVLVEPAAKVMAPLAKKAGTAMAMAMEELIAKAKQFGLDLTPAEITKSKGLQLLENFLSNLPWSAGRIDKARMGQLENLVKHREALIEKGGGEQVLEEVGLRIRNLVDDSVKNFNTFNEQNLARLKDRVMAKAGSKETYHDLIQPLQEINEKNIARLRAQKNKLYDNAKDLIPEDLVVLPENLINAAMKMRDELKVVSPALRDQASLNLAEELVSGAVPRNVEQLMANRKALNDLIAKETDFATKVTTPAGRNYELLKAANDADIENIVKATGNDVVLDAWQIANKANADFKNYVKDPLVKKIASGKKPEAIVGAVYSPGNDTEIKKFQEYYGKDFSERAKKVFTNSFLNLSPDPSIPDAPITGEFIRNQMRRFGTTLNTIYTPAEVNYLRRIANVFDGRAEMAAEVVKNPLMRSILKSPRVSGIIDLIVKPRDVGNLAIIKQYVGPEGVKEVQQGLLNKILVKNQVGNFAPQTFAREFNKYEPRVLKQVFPEKIYNDLKSLSEVSMRVGGAEQLAGNPSGTSRNLIVPFGLGFLVHNKLTGGAIILGSRAFTELYLSDFGRKWLTEGFKLPAMSSKAAEVASKISLAMLEREKEQLKKQGEEQ